MKPSTAITLLAALAGHSVAAPTGNAALQAQQPDTNALRLLATHISTGELTQSDRVLLSHLLAAASSLQKRGVDAADAAGGADGLLDGLSHLLTQLLGGLLGGGHDDLDQGDSVEVSVPSSGVNERNSSARTGAVLDQHLQNQGTHTADAADPADNIFTTLGSGVGGLLNGVSNVLTQLLGGLLSGSHGDSSSGAKGLNSSAPTGAVSSVPPQKLSHPGAISSIPVNSTTLPANISLPENGISIPINITSTTGNVGGALSGSGLDLGKISDTVNEFLKKLIGDMDGAVISSLTTIITNAKGDGQKAADDIHQFAASHGYDSDRIFATLDNVMPLQNLNANARNLLESSGGLGGLLGGLANALHSLTGKGSIGLPGGINLGSGALPTGALTGLNTTIGGLAGGILSRLNMTLGKLPSGVVNTTVGNITSGLSGNLNGTVGDLTGGLRGLSNGLGGGSSLLGALVNDFSGLFAFWLHLLGLGGIGGHTSGLLSGSPAANLTGSLGPLTGNVTGTLGSITGSLPGEISDATNTAGSTLESVASGLNTTLNGTDAGLGLATVQLSDASDENNTALVFDLSGSGEDDEGSPRSNIRRSHTARLQASVRAANVGVAA
ncbi:hypothetical protein MKX08_000698 [Trichoderma sp. CBMAI-0020]|nr:hypothetical protein MKX08_000698 [Trichoderma sp. CBMAI-0020]